MDLQNHIEESVKLSHREQDKQICIFADASAFYLTGVVTKVSADELQKEVLDKRHEPLAFLGAGLISTRKRDGQCLKRKQSIYTTF